MPAGLWMRPAFYGSDMETAVRGEVLAARKGVGLIDVSTLGGLDIRGPHAASFLERIYTWTYGKLAVGRVRYALMLDETGVIIDDGVAARLHERHFYVTATTGGVDRVFRLMQFYNAQWRMMVRHRQRHRRLCGGEPDRPSLPRGPGAARHGHRYRRRKSSLISASARAALAAYRRGSCASALAASLAMKSTSPPAGARNSGTRRWRQASLSASGPWASRPSAYCVWKRATLS